MKEKDRPFLNKKTENYFKFKNTPRMTFFSKNDKKKSETNHAFKQ